MTERLLQYIWQFRLFNMNDLETTNGDKLVIIYPGIFNTNQGPDFLEARIRIETNTWVGNVELHTKASDWHKHAHAFDPNYKNLILHVVWNDDDEHPVHDIPTLLLADRVPKVLLQQYTRWMEKDSVFPCAPYLGSVKDITWTSWKERLLVERIERKSLNVLAMLNENNSWDETCWWLTARSYGLPVNAEAFEEIARLVPYRLLMEHRRDLRQVKNILIERSEMIEQPLHFLRMRPAAFPTARLNQLAVLIHEHGEFWPLILYACDTKQLRTVFPDNVIINSVAPLLAAYGCVEKAIGHLSNLPVEKNAITRGFEKYAVENKNAAASQALIELKTQYCDRHRCLDCAIGNAVLKGNSKPGPSS